ncbi:MAG TPA: 5'-3' exonuclease H3TH domain-containing protein [Gammaproteobacteria bacterium]
MKQSQPRAYLIDSSIYVFRAWFTVPDTITDLDGHPVNALYGFADFLLNLLEREQPRHIACAFDESLETSYRNTIYPAYKANREPAPPELKRQFQYCRELVRAAGIAEFASDHYEADDIIGTFSRHMRRHGFQNMIISGDKDLAQLLVHRDYWWEYARNRRMNREDVYDHFGVYPEQIADLLALAGDAVDNIPGVPGIGLKTAAKILNKFGTLENTLDNIEQIGNMKFRGAKRAQQLLEEHQDKARLSKQLTVIVDDANLPDDHQALHRQPRETGLLETLLEHFGFGEFRRKRWLAAVAA